MTSYVLGFSFTCDLRSVILINKTRPTWQAGRLNGIGGHIEKNETPTEAMVREFVEETGWAAAQDWQGFGRLSGRDWEVFLFRSRSNVPSSDRDYILMKTGEEGSVAIFSVADVLKGTFLPLPNLRYLIPMALNHISGEDQAEYFEIIETTRPVVLPSD